jgi:hypothetical protein
MKTILTIILTFVSILGIGQNLPKYHIVNGDTIGIILSTEQVQKLDNNTELMYIYERMILDAQTLDFYYIEVIKDMSQKIDLLSLKILNSDSIINQQELAIDILQKMVDNREIDSKLCNKQRENDALIIKKLEKKIRNDKWKKFVSWGVGGLATAGIIISIILK